MTTSTRSMLVIDPDASARSWLSEELSVRGWCAYASSGWGESDAAGQASEWDRSSSFAAALVDVSRTEDAFKWLRERRPELPIVAVGSVASASQVVACMRAGAVDFLPKPCEARELERVLSRLEAAEIRPVHARVARGLRGPLTSELDSAMHGLFEMLDRVARTDVTVLITGESGSGKEYVADWIHSHSHRLARPFVKVNCAALPARLLESELFGYEKGAFTGADARKPGKFELAHRGTLFLDEISEMSPELQAKLLQVLQDRSFARLGGESDVAVDVRILAATHRDLRREVECGRFREDLFYRLNVVHLRVPPLRERRAELLGLAEEVGRRVGDDVGRPHVPLTPALRRAFESYAWPGNVRELENMLKRWAVLQSEPSILEYIERQTALLRKGAVEEAARDQCRGPRGVLGSFLAGEREAVSLREVSREAALRAERRAIERVLEHTRWNRRRTAELLQVSYKALLYKMRDAGLGAEGGGRPGISSGADSSPPRASA